jgi:hypothetical protein
MVEARENIPKILREGLEEMKDTMNNGIGTEKLGK